MRGWMSELVRGAEISLCVRECMWDMEGVGGDRKKNGIWRERSGCKCLESPKWCQGNTG